MNNNYSTHKHEKKKIINTEIKFKNANKIIHRTKTETETGTEEETIPYRRDLSHDIIILEFN